MTYYYADMQDDIETWVDDNPKHEALEVWKDGNHYAYFEPTTGMRGWLEEDEYATAKAEGITL